MSAEPISSGVRAVLDAPRGRRFSHTRTGTAPPTREQRLLAQMEGNPRVAYRQTHGPLPAWMHTHAARLAFREAQTPNGPPLPPRPQRPPLLRCPRSHRKPRDRSRRTRTGRHLLGYILATLAGALTHYLIAGFFF